MFARILEAIGLRRQNNVTAEVERLKTIRPKELPVQIVSEGNPAHHHKLEKVEWNRERFGSDTTDFDKDHGTKLEFPMCTCKELFRCSCGRELFRSERSLI